VVPLQRGGSSLKALIEARLEAMIEVVVAIIETIERSEIRKQETIKKKETYLENLERPWLRWQLPQQSHQR